MYNRAFTLIELLVVISIIGALASIVIGSLNTARDKAADTAIKSNMNHMRAQTNIYFSDYGHYGSKVESTDCEDGIFADPVINTAITESVAKNGGEEADCVSSGPGANADSWAISVPLKTDTGDTWCVDSQGVAIQGGVAGVTDNVASCE